MNRKMEKIMEVLKKNQKELSIALFCVVALAVILISVLWLKTPVVAVCSLVILETILAVVLHQMELWIHGVLVVVELIAGAVLSRIVLVVLCVLVYIAATVTLQFIFKKEN